MVKTVYIIHHIAICTVNLMIYMLSCSPDMWRAITVTMCICSSVVVYRDAILNHKDAAAMQVVC